MTTPTPEEAREALMKLADDYAHNHADEAVALIVTEEPVDCGSATKRAELDMALRRFIDAHSAPVQPEPVAPEVGEGWEALAWQLCADENGEDACNELVWEGGPIPEPWGDRWLKYEGEAKRMIALVSKHASPPPAQPVQSACVECGGPLQWRCPRRSRNDG